MPEVLELIKRMHIRLTPPEARTRFAVAKTANGTTLPTGASELATSWCIIGACDAELAKFEPTPRDRGGMLHSVLKELKVTAVQMGESDAVNLNYTADHSKVMVMFERTITRMEAQ